MNIKILFYINNYQYNTDKIFMNKNNKILMKKKIYCNKIISRAKTLIVENINLNELKNYSVINIDKIELDFGLEQLTLEKYNNMCSLLNNSQIIISADPNPTNDFIKLLTVPGHLFNYTQISNKIEIDFNFSKFYPNGIPINFNKFFPNEIPINFNKFFPNEIPINKILYVNIMFDKLVCDELNYDFYICYNLVEESIPSTSHVNETIFVQDTQTFRSHKSLMVNSILDIKIRFRYMCRGFWIRMGLNDYENLNRFKILLNGQIRLELDYNLLDMVVSKKIIGNNEMIFYLNLEFDETDWNLPKDIESCKQIYSNSCNMSRIDTIRFFFEFEKDYIDNKFITISSIYSKLVYCSNFSQLK